MEDKERLTELVEAFQKGDSDAFGQIYQMTDQNLYIYAKYLMKNEDAAQDLLQDTYTEILKSIGNLKDPGAFITWSKRIMLNCSNHKFKKASREVTPEDEQAAEMFDQIEDQDSKFHPEETFDNYEMRQALLEIMDELPPHHRMALVAFYVDDMSIKEIAEAMDIPEATVKSRLFYARSSFRSKVSQYESRYNVRLHALMPVTAMLRSLRYTAADPLFHLGAGASQAILEKICARSGLDAAKAVAALHAGAADGAAGAAGSSAGAAGSSAAGTAGTSGTASASAGTAAGSSAGTATGSSAGVVAGASAGAAGGAGTVATGGLLAKFAATGVGTRVVAAGVAAAVAVGGGGTAIVHHRKAVKDDQVISAYEAYYEEIGEKQYSIGNTNGRWQLALGDENEKVKTINRPVALYDVTGDGIPELFQMEEQKEDYTGTDPVMEMHIYTYDPDADKIMELKYDNTGEFAGGYEKHLLISCIPNDETSTIVYINADGDFCTYEHYFDDAEEAQIRKYKLEGDHLKQVDFLDYEQQIDPVTYKRYPQINGKTVTDDEVKKRMRDELGNMKQMILYSDCGDDLRRYGVTNIKDSDALQMSVDDMLDFLEARIEENADDTGGTTLPDGVEKMKFYCWLGGSGPVTEMTLKKDGTFSGFTWDQEVDWDRSENSDDTYWQMYESHFTGEFGKIKKTGDHEYTMYLKSLKFTKKPGTEEIKDDGVRYTYTDQPSGLENGKVFKLYTPGQDTSGFSEEFMWWIQKPKEFQLDNPPDKLPGYIIKNVRLNKAFYQDDDNAFD